ncbi:MAG TPA: F0F1 ATP synthase subunit gamma [Burkholderiaceae bacterium]|nr:F0F1 ATP synthase subunit gamma [Burkholderiaceae bacterium]
MDPRELELQSRRATVSAFGDVVNAMRSVAAAREQRALAMIAGVDAYASTVAAAMAQARALMRSSPSRPEPARREPSLWVLIGVEQGFNGGFAEQLLVAAPEAVNGRVLLLGTHTLRLARARGCTPEWSAPMISHADAATATSDALHKALGKALGQRPAAAVEIVAAEVTTPDPGGDARHVAVQRRRLLPLSWPQAAASTDPLPLTHLPPARLIEELAFEYVAARLVRAVLHGHAAENLSRARAMAAARENVDRMVQTLDAQEHRLRQEAITEEIIELAAGLRGEAT